MNSNPQTKKIKIIKKTATVEPQTATVEPQPATVEPQTATVEPQTATVEPQTTRPLADIYENHVYFCCMLEAKNDGKVVLTKTS